MYITWFGQGCFKVQGKDMVMVSDPYTRKTGLKLSHLKADVVILSNTQSKDYSLIKPIDRGETESKVFSVSMPGEYETKGVFIYGILSLSKETGLFNVLYRIEMEGLIIAYLGELNQILNDEQLGSLNGVDILMVPVGGKNVLDTKKAVEVVNQIEPRIIVPMFYKIPNLKINFSSVNKFCQEMGIKMKEPLKKLKISKKELPQEETELIILEVQNKK